MIGFRGHPRTLRFVLSSLMVLLFFMGVRKLMQRIVTRSHGGKPIEQGVIVMIILGALSVGFITDMFGLAIANGPMWLGLVIPDGPPLGSLLVEKTETIATDILMPFSFAFIGMYVDLANIAFIWPALKPLVAMVVIGYVTKILATFLTSLYFKMPVRDSLALSFLLSVRGQVEFLLFMHWMDKEVHIYFLKSKHIFCNFLTFCFLTFAHTIFQILHPSYFTMMVLLTVLITGLVTPLISLLYDPTKPYMISKRRTIQHTAPGADLRIMLTIEEQDKVAGLISLLEASNPSVATPFSVIALCLIELIGRAAPVFIDHERQRKVPPQYAGCLTIHNALSLYQESYAEYVKLHSYTAVTPKRTVYQVCTDTS